MNPDGSGQVNLTDDDSFNLTPAWSPDGTKIAFASDRSGNTEVYVMNANGTGVVNLSQNPADDRSPTWSPDGSEIAFTTTRDGNDEIYVMESITGSGQTNLTNYFVHDSEPDWSPDGTKIAFSFGNFDDRDIAVMEADGSDSVLVTTSPGVDDFSPSWSPDGTHIIFTSDRDGNDEIYVMTSTGSNQRSLTSDAAGDITPAWSPDCTKIAFRSNRTGYESIWVMNVDGSDAVNVSNTVPPFPIDSSPDWQRQAGVGELDCDADGFGNTVEDACGSDSYDAASVPERTDTPGDDDGDGQLNEALPPGSEAHDCDGDTVIGSADNCPQVPNTAGQTADADGDIAGDACDGAGSGNVDCSGPAAGVNSIDALKLLRYSSSLSVTQSEPCLDVGLVRLLAPPDDWRMGDVDCSGTVNSVDALKILRANAGLSVAKPPGCPEVKPPG
jgi:dipeptidyl aminopeptidase/acylaminoacyl peptidase